MYLVGERVVTSASDLTNASKCEFAFLRALDAKLGRIEAVEEPEDAMLERAGRLGDAHELRVLERYREEFGDGVVEIERPDVRDPAQVAEAVRRSAEAFDRGAPVVFQATFAADDFIGFADFIVRMPDGRYRVQDTKLARRARVTALLQLAAYAERLALAGIPVDGTVELLLGDGSVSAHRLADIEPVYRLRRARLARIVEERLREPGPVAWGDPRYTVCGHCAACALEIEAHRDLLLVAGMRLTQRERLLAAGIGTIDELAASRDPVPEMAQPVLDGLRAQARLQLEARDGAPPPFVAFNASALAAIPEPDEGDLFFDFEGDPLYTEGDRDRWGLDYLFGVVEADGTFRAWWAHDFAAEREALLGFLAYVAERRRRYPGLHIHHYAAYERTHLLSLAARHGVGEEEVDQLLREHVLVDLYPLVRKALRVGSPSYSLKKLEPMYMGAEARAGEVTTAADSIQEYVRAREAIATGEVAEGERILAEIADYNAYDCRSTLRLRDWLLARAAEAGVVPSGPPRIEEPQLVEPSPLATQLLARAGDRDDPDRTADEAAAALAASAIDYHRREQKSFWWGHYSRLVDPIDEWAETRDVLRVTDARIEEDWHRGPRDRNDRRILRLTGEWAPGSRPSPTERSGPFLLYEHPGPYPDPRDDPGARSWRSVKVREVSEEDGSVLVEEVLPGDAETHTALPSALTPGAPPDAGGQKAAIEWWAQSVVDGGPGAWPEDPASDLLRRRPPRTAGGDAGLAPVPSADPDRAYVDAVVASLLRLDRSYLAVQGPPGTGKTHLASRVIRELVERHAWRIGVVAQSHAVVEHVLEAVVAAGLDPRLVGKVPKSGEAAQSATYTRLLKDEHEVFALERQLSGFVLGGTAWDFSNTRRVGRRSLELLVIDEAGQFSLASTIAASTAAKNLMLLGDPQQLPQVSQGTHPEPVDRSALGWIAEGHEVLPPDRGYFLAESRRMHPALAAPVSALAYEGELRSHPAAARRVLAGVAAGVHLVPVAHEGNATESAEEAREVARIASSLLGRTWDCADDTGPRPLVEDDLIVVTPYNAQLQRIRAELDAAGLPEVRVGTVDKFQGQEAVVAIVSLAASAAADVPRGIEFLLSKNRLNVAISRAQWAAYLVYSPGLLDHLPRTPDGVAQLSAFARLVGAAPQ